MAAEHRIMDLEQRCGRAVRHGHMADAVQILYYFAERSTRDEVRDTSNPQTSRKEPRGR